MIKLFYTLVEHVKRCGEMLEGIYKLLQEVIGIMDSRGEAPSAQDTLSENNQNYPEKEENLWTIQATCYELRIVRSTLFKLRKEGLIEEVRMGRHVRFRESDVRRLREWYSIPKGKL